VRFLFASLLLALCAGCSLVGARKVDHLATAQVSSDFDTYAIHRVGLLPVIGRELDVEHAALLQSALYTELSLGTPFEIVPLTGEDMEEVEHGQPYLRGRYQPDMVIGLARRYRFDAMLLVTVIDASFYSPLRLSMQVELIATETGAAIWSSAVQLDASSPRVQEAVEAFYDESGAVEAQDGQGWEIALLSPTLFARFGAWQIARLL